MLPRSCADLVNVHFLQAEKVVLVCNNRNTHQHGSWLNIAASEFAALAAQCLDRRIESTAKVHDHNTLGVSVNWQLMTADARIKLLHLHLTFK